MEDDEVIGNVFPASFESDDQPHIVLHQYFFIAVVIGQSSFCHLWSSSFVTQFRPCESLLLVQWRGRMDDEVIGKIFLASFEGNDVLHRLHHYLFHRSGDRPKYLLPLVERRWSQNQFNKRKLYTEKKEKMSDSKKKEKGFFKVFNPESSSQRMKIPTAFVKYKKGKLPKKVSLRDKYGNMWPIGLAKKDGATYFQEGWAKFIEENSLEFGDFLIFDYDKNGVYDFKLLGNNACEKRGARPLKSVVKEEEEEEEEMNVVQKSEEPTRMIREDDTDKSSSDSDNDEDEDYKVEEDEDEDEEEVESEKAEEETEEDEETDEEAEENENAFILKRRSPNPEEKCKRDTGKVDEETEEEEEEGDEKNEKAVMFKKKALHSNGKRKSANAIKKRDLPDQYDEIEEEELNEMASLSKKKSSHSKAKRFKRASASKKKHIPNQYVEGDEEEEEENEKAVMSKKKALHSNGKRKRANTIKKRDLPGQYEELEKGIEEDDEENKKATLLKKKSPHSKARPKRIMEELPDHCGAEIFKSGGAVQPKNPYFVTTIRKSKRGQLFIPRDVIRDYNLELPQTMIIHDSAGREYKAKLKRWKDGRLSFTGGWINLRRWNLVEIGDRCICEFVKGKEGLHLQVQVLHEGEDSKPAREDN